MVHKKSQGICLEGKKLSTIIPHNSENTFFFKMMSYIAYVLDVWVTASTQSWTLGNKVFINHCLKAFARGKWRSRGWRNDSMIKATFTFNSAWTFSWLILAIVNSLFGLSDTAYTKRKTWFDWTVFIVSLNPQLLKVIGHTLWIVKVFILFKHDLGQKYQATQVQPKQGSNSWPPDHDSTFHVTETPALATSPSVTHLAIRIRSVGDYTYV